MTEFDLRAPEFKHPGLKPSDFERRADGKIVLKGRWERGMREVADIVNMPLTEHEIPEVVQKIDDMWTFYHDLGGKHICVMQAILEGKKVIFTPVTMGDDGPVEGKPMWLSPEQVKEGITPMRCPHYKWRVAETREG